jgi:hypothetical protein
MVLIAQCVSHCLGHFNLTFTSLPTDSRNGSLKGFAGLGRQGVTHCATLANF